MCVCVWGMHVHSWEFRQSLWSQFSPLPSHALQRSNLGCQREQESLPTEYLILFYYDPIDNSKKKSKHFSLNCSSSPPSLKCIHVVHMCICRFVYMWRPKKNIGDPLCSLPIPSLKLKLAIFLTRQMANKDFSLVLLPPSIAGVTGLGSSVNTGTPKQQGSYLQRHLPIPTTQHKHFLLTKYHS